VPWHELQLLSPGAPVLLVGGLSEYAFKNAGQAMKANAMRVTPVSERRIMALSPSPWGRVRGR
jgi:hypothetical protein